VLAVAAATLVWWWKHRTTPNAGILDIAWLWIAWFLAAPFAHFHDEVVLTLPVLAVLGRDAAWMGRWPATVALYVVLFSIFAFPTARAHTDAQSLTLLVVLACSLVQLWRAHAIPSHGDGIPAEQTALWAEG